MQAKLRRLHSPDVDDLRAYRPPDPSVFSLLVQVIVGPADSMGEESFDVEICTPQWLTENYGSDDIIMGQHRLIVFQYDYSRLVRWIEKYVHRCSGASWQEVAAKLSRLGAWEFEDYRLDRKGLRPVPKPDR